jgi:two-component system chemotaxis response regulator CheY
MMNKGSSHAGEPGGLPADQEHKSFSKRIPVVDDDNFIRSFYRDILGGSGYHVDMAEDGAAGAAALQAASYDLLITDNNMPKVSGVELIQKLRSNRMTLPIIMASGTPPAAEVKIHLAATLLKPFTPEELLATVKKVLGETDSISRQLEFMHIIWDSPITPL